MGTDPPLLRASGLCKAWDGVPVLVDLDLEVRAGGHVLVHGPSGSGKSTLLNLLARLVRPDRGTIHLRGVDARQVGRPERYRMGNLGLVFQEVHLLDSLDVAKNIEIVRAASGGRGPSVRELLEPLGMFERARVRTAVLSRGERQRVALARAFANGPALVLADEPTASLDPGNRDRTLDHLFALSQRTSATVVVVSHDLAMARRPEFAAIFTLQDGALRRRPDSR